MKAALASPLAVKLMGIQGISSVFFGPDFVSVQKDEDTPWSLIKPEVFSFIMEHFSSGAPLFKDQSAEQAALEDGEPEDTKILDDDSEIVATIKELISTRIRPSIMEDGGDLEFKGFNDDTGVVRVRLKGSCRGCSSSEVTLKSGIERMLMHYVPEVTTVEQVRACFLPSPPHPPPPSFSLPHSPLLCRLTSHSRFSILLSCPRNRYSMKRRSSPSTSLQSLRPAWPRRPTSRTGSFLPLALSLSLPPFFQLALLSDELT